ncbi:hypothetical protein [Magnetococcus sp. PR-3]|uniref:hypothetical protein n=1 Tax=Magnetococcus sp. PR-3 TaxID=3120355 RepID=UPI002FCE350E
MDLRTLDRYEAESKFPLCRLVGTIPLAEHLPAEQLLDQTTGTFNALAQLHQLSHWSKRQQDPYLNDL